MRYYFASDIHLGLTICRSKEEQEALFLSWLDMVATDFATFSNQECGLFLLGDIFDFWFEYKRVIPMGYTSVLAVLQSLCQKGVNIWFIPGNHDLWTKGFLEKEIGLKVVYKSFLDITLFDKRFYMAHGDSATAGSKFITRLLFSIFHSSLAYKLFSTFVHPDIAMWFGNKWSNKSRKSKYIAHKFMGEDEPVVRFARKMVADKGDVYDYFVFGHLHCDIVHSLTPTKSTLAVLGHWIDGEPVYGVFDKEGFSLKNFKI